MENPHKFVKPLIIFKLAKPRVPVLRKNIKDTMALFLPPNVEPLAPAADLKSWNDQSMAGLDNAEFFKMPKGTENRSVSLDYTQL